MNRSTAFVLAALFSLSSVAKATEHVSLPAGSQGEVTLDWSKFREMWTQMQGMERKIEDLQKPENLPPVPFTITKAAYKGYVGEFKTEMTAIFEIDVYDPKNWVKIPFLPSSIAITEAQLNGQPVGVVQEDGFHQVLLKKPGRYILRAKFAMKSPKPEEAPQLSFMIQPTPMTLLSLEFPRPKLDVQIEPSQGTDVQAVGDKHTLVTAALPPTSYVNVRWQKALPEETAGPAKLYLDTQSLLTVSEGTLKAHWNLNYSVLRHGVRELRIQMPENWNVLAVTCDGLQEWKTIDSSKATVLLVQLVYARKGNVELSIQMERALGDKDEVIEIPRLKALDIEREQGTVGVEIKGAVEVAVQNAAGLQAMDPRELVGGLWQSASQPIMLAFRYTKPSTLELSIKRHPETPVLTTTVDDANAVTVLTDRGQLITKIRYQVRNQLKQYLAFKLPPGTELWSAFVAGEPVKPMKAEDGTFRIPLAKSQLENQGQAGFPVELITYRQSSKFMPIGLKTLTLPMPDAPVSRMLWSVYLPEKYRFPYFGGDVEKGAMAEPWNALQGNAIVDHSEGRDSGVLGQKDKEWYREDLKKLTGRMMAVSALKSAAADEIVAKQADMAASLFQEKNAIPVSTGIFPVAFELPASGQLFHFGQIMVVGQDPQLTMAYLHVRILHVLFLLLLGSVGMFMHRRRSILADFLLHLGAIQAIRSRIKVETQIN